VLQFGIEYTRHIIVKQESKSFFAFCKIENKQRSFSFARYENTLGFVASTPNWLTSGTN
jgi:hypothetical protein